MADTTKQGLQKREKGLQQSSISSTELRCFPNRIQWWNEDPAERNSESRLGRVAHGVAHRVDRLKAIGNGQVPAVVERAWEILAG